MKTILIPAYHRQQVKVVFLSDILKELLKRADVRLIFLVPSYRVEEYEKEFLPDTT